ncbi:MAG TPA: FAD-dependent oxidoreductase [Solirubrobacteraceae bacterium]|nr:FAD-dependent oxidoreductase [Solirubrobacteraceae bacterium]
MRIAIIGAGISGIAVAHRLHLAHDVTVFEADGRPGGHANTIRVDTAYETHHVDTGFIVFNDRNYPNFERLLADGGVASQASEMSFSVADESGDFEYNGASPNGLFAKRAHLAKPWFHRMVLDLARFNRAARELLTGDDEGPSLGEWLERHRFSRPFVERLIVPQAAAVWSADPTQMWSFPARFMVEFFDHHGMLGFAGRPKWRTIRGGSHNYVRALIAPWRERLRLSTPVRSLQRFEDRVEVHAAGALEPERFDHVVLATHSDQALKLLGCGATDTERELLSAIPYQDNEAILHTDAGLLPRRRRAWASWNYHLLAEPTGRVAVTYHLNRLQSLRAAEQFCVTLNRSQAIDPEKIIRKIDYAHPVYTNAGIKAQARHAEIDGRNRTSFCGAWWGSGFHEDGAASGVRVAERLERAP